MRRTAAAAALIAGLLVTGLASAQDVGDIEAHLSPERAGRASTLHVQATGASALGTAIPDSIVLAVQRGFRIDPRAVARRCSAAQAAALACPSASAIGSGSAQITASGPLLLGVPQTVVATLRGFLAPPHAGEVAGVILQVDEPKTGTHHAVRGSVVARATGRYGYEVHFDGFGTTVPVVPPGITITLDRLSLKLGAQRHATVGGHRQTLVLVRNPTRCTSGHWAGQLRISAAGAEQRHNVLVSCR